MGIKTAVAVALGIAALSAAGGYGLGTLVQGRETARIQKEFDDAVIAQGKAYSKSLEDARRKEKGWRENAKTWEKKANELQEKNKVFEDRATVADTRASIADKRASTAEQRLRDEGNEITAFLNRMSSNNIDTLKRVAEASTAALGECSERARSLGGRVRSLGSLLRQIDGDFAACEIERQTMIGGWPK
jgi:chromosome segregation ATPase